ncbi:MAG: hypothetical protein IJV70_06030 [Clostridia bacterium]|nr:hypothetical protein [Clostridia bacterium]
MAENSIIVPGTGFEWGGSVTGSCVAIEIIQHDRTGTGSETGENLLDGLVAQQVQAQIQKSTRQLYEVGTTKYFLIEGRPQGTGTIQHVLGPNTKNIWTHIKDFANVCKATDLKVGSTGCTCKDTETAVSTVMFVGGLLNSMQVSANAQDFVLMSNLGFMFFDLQDAEAPLQPEGAGNGFLPEGVGF